MAAGENQPGGAWWEQVTSGVNGFRVLVASLLAEHQPNLSAAELLALVDQLLEQNALGLLIAVLAVVSVAALRSAIREFSVSAPSAA